ncbi:response regulator [Dactylosporangium sp. NPDC049742]|uniref:response regulator transcription factor n=1 Tax=Dactylosporangium sp. NPDC049742 TaxID=3154737 RepID=UPI00343AF8E0
MELVGSKTEWAAAEFWTVDDVAYVLRRATHWVDRGHALPRPVRDPLACGEGIPGRAWQAAAPVHEADLLLDLVMPGLNGLDVCRALRADPATADVPILMLSAYAMPADLQAGLDAGADDHMMKPFQSDELIARCTALIK